MPISSSEVVSGGLSASKLYLILPNKENILWAQPRFLLDQVQNPGLLTQWKVKLFIVVLERKHPDHIALTGSPRQNPIPDLVWVSFYDGASLGIAEGKSLSGPVNKMESPRVDFSSDRWLSTY